MHSSTRPISCLVVVERAGDALRAAGYHLVMDVTDCAAAKETVEKAEELAKRM